MMKFLREFPLTNLLDFSFSPNEAFVCTWTRYQKPKTDSQICKNLIIWNLQTGANAISFPQKSNEGWNIKWTDDERYCAKMVANEIFFYDPSDFTKGAVSRLKIEGISSFSLSPGKRPVVAVFVVGKNGQPSSSRIYDIGNFSNPLSQKTFMRADSCTFHWNALGTNVLVFTHTDVDKTGQSYYGETNLYYLSITGNFDCRVELDHAGPIHEVAWSPNSKEFIVVYGSMPAKSTLFDHRASPIYELGTAARNTVKYSPSGRFFLLGGFGNLAGEMDVYERRSFKKIAVIGASNSSMCEWSPCGRYILTAILYRRLKVDNGIKVWHYSGTLSHTVEVKEMYSCEWRPMEASLWPERNAKSPSPVGIKPAALAKPAGKYVPPGARGANRGTVGTSYVF
jgi:translation initiation factor 2A